MSIDDVVALVTKMHLEPGDILVIEATDIETWRLDAFWRAWNSAVTAAAPKNLKDLLIIVRSAEDPDLEKLGDDEARRLYDVLKRRLYG